MMVQIVTKTSKLDMEVAILSMLKNGWEPLGSIGYSMCKDNPRSALIEIFVMVFIKR